MKTEPSTSSTTPPVLPKRGSQKLIRPLLWGGTWHGEYSVFPEYWIGCTGFCIIFIGATVSQKAPSDYINTDIAISFAAVVSAENIPMAICPSQNNWGSSAESIGSRMDHIVYFYGEYLWSSWFLPWLFCRWFLNMRFIIRRTCY